MNRHNVGAALQRFVEKELLPTMDSDAASYWSELQRTLTVLKSEHDQAFIGNVGRFLDDAIPLDGASHCDVVSYSARTIWRKAECIATLADGSEARLLDAWQFVGFTGRDPVRSLLFQSNGLYIELQIATGDPIGKATTANLSDVLLASAITTIQNCEGNVATGTGIDDKDKGNVYKRWLELAQLALGTNGRAASGGTKAARTCTAVDGSLKRLPRRSLTLVRNFTNPMLPAS